MKRLLVTENLKAKLYPTLPQRVWLTKQFGNCRFVWNNSLDFCKAILRHFRKIARKYGVEVAKRICAYPTKTLLNHHLTLLKRVNRWLRISDSRSLQVSYQNLLNTYQRYNRGLSGKPHYKSRKDYKQSYMTTSIPKQQNYCNQNKLKVAKLGTVEAHYNQIPLGHRILQMVITKRPDGRYYATLTVQCDKQALPLTGKVLGIDVGLRDEAIFSNGTKVPFKDFGKKYESKRKYWERIASRRLIRARNFVKQANAYSYKHHSGSASSTLLSCHNYQRARKIRARYFQREKNARHDFLQKLTTRIVRHYDIVVIEDLKVSNMMKNHHSARAIAQASWRKFRVMLAYKCWWYHKKLIVINPVYTTQECHNCGYVCNRKDHTFVKWGVESWICPNCGAKHDRDVNAAVNIKNRGLKQLKDRLIKGLGRASGKRAVDTSLFAVVRNPTLISLGYLVSRSLMFPQKVLFG